MKKIQAMALAVGLVMAVGSLGFAEQASAPAAGTGTSQVTGQAAAAPAKQTKAVKHHHAKKMKKSTKKDEKKA